jgi:purine-nucleoside phosphorylase
MEIAAFFAIAQEKNVQGLALYVISDSLADGKWNPHLQDSSVKDNIKEIADLAIEFSKN